MPENQDFWNVQECFEMSFALTSALGGYNIQPMDLWVRPPWFSAFQLLMVITQCTIIILTFSN